MTPQELRIMGVFDRLDNLLKAIEQLREERFMIEEVYSPAPVEEIPKKLGMRQSWIRWFFLAGACSGLLLAYFTTIYSASAWELDVWGKPFVAWIPYSLIAYEWTILVAVIAGFIWVIILAQNKSFRDPPLYDPRFTVDRFGVLVRCNSSDREHVFKLFEETKAEKIDESHS